MQRLLLLKNHLSETNKPKIRTQTIEDGTIGEVILCSPENYNQLSPEMIIALEKCFQTVSEDPKVKVIILRSEVERIFSAGANPAQFQQLSIESQARKYIAEPMENLVRNCKQPIIALVNGFALGGGFELALIGDILLMSEDAKLGLLETNYGIVPGAAGTQRLTKMMGKYNAMRYILTGGMFGAEEAQRMHICQGIYKDEELYAEGIKLAKRIIQMPMITTLITKRAVLSSDESGVNNGVKYSYQIMNNTTMTKAVKEGRAAFIEKRKPKYQDL